MSILLAMALTGAVQGNTSWTAYDAADANLVTAYEALIAHRTGVDRTALRNSERAWIAERNRTCGFERRNACATRITRSRTQILEGQLLKIASYRGYSDQRLMAIERALDETCRGGPGQDPDGPVCSRRDAAYAELQRRGFKD